MSIQNPKEYVNGQPDYRMFNDLFPGKIEMSDIDGVVERNRHFLFLEWKKPGVELGYGQRTMYQRLKESNRSMHSVVIVWGQAPLGPVKQIQRIGTDDKPIDMDLAGLRELIGEWVHYVDPDFVLPFNSPDKATEPTAMEKSLAHPNAQHAHNNDQLNEIRAGFIEEYGYMPKAIGPDGQPFPGEIPRQGSLIES